MAQESVRKSEVEKLWSPWWYNSDLNTVILAVLFVWFQLWLFWAMLPVLAGSRAWLMDLTSSGYKLDAFHVGLEQYKLEREPLRSIEEFQKKYASHAGVLAVPLSEAKVAIYNEQANAIDFSLRPVTVGHSQGGRAIPLAAWHEEMFPHFVRHYFAVISDREPMRAACYRMLLPTDPRARDAMLRDAYVRYAFSVNPAAVTRLESIAPPPGSERGISRAFMLGIVIERISLVSSAGQVVWSRDVARGLQRAGELEC